MILQNNIYDTDIKILNIEDLPTSFNPDFLIEKSIDSLIKLYENNQKSTTKKNDLNTIYEEKDINEDKYEDEDGDEKEDKVKDKEEFDEVKDEIKDEVKDEKFDEDEEEFDKVKNDVKDKVKDEEEEFDEDEEEFDEDADYIYNIEEDYYLKEFIENNNILLKLS